VLVGASYGGGVALELARDECSRSSSRLRGLVLIDAAGLYFPPPPRIRYARSPLLRWWTEEISDAKAVARILVDGSFHRPERVSERLIADVAWPLRLPGTRRAIRQAAIEMFDELESRKADACRYAGISCPTLLIWGEHDRTVPRDVMTRLNQMIANSRCEILSDCGHTPHEECPEQLAPILRDFVAQSLQVSG
jgi:4,5:9,10-diseco-3-hydroxy-5,9,17-trioxoandrosta-1(10),2-diene-4-oate hydrolase